MVVTEDIGDILGSAAIDDIDVIPPIDVIEGATTNALW
jgi:hypothetical protein